MAEDNDQNLQHGFIFVAIELTTYEYVHMKINIHWLGFLICPPEIAIKAVTKMS